MIFFNQRLLSACQTFAIVFLRGAGGTLSDNLGTLQLDAAPNITGTFYACKMWNGQIAPVGNTSGAFMVITHLMVLMLIQTGK